MKEKPGGTNITLRCNSLWQAVSHAILNDSVSSVIPSPMAPNFLTSNKPDATSGLGLGLGLALGLGASSGALLVGEGSGAGGSEISDDELWECE